MRNPFDDPFSASQRDARAAGMLVAWLLSFLIVGCAHAGDELRKPPQEPCQVAVRVDGGPWRCQSRRRTVRELCEISGCTP